MATKNQASDAAALEARQRAAGCNQDNEPGDWGVPCCDLCGCKRHLGRVQIVMRALYDSHPTAMPPFKSLRPDVLAIFRTQAETVLEALKDDML